MTQGFAVVRWLDQPLTHCWRCMDRKAAYDSPAGLCDPCREYLLDDTVTDDGAWAPVPEAAPDLARWPAS